MILGRGVETLKNFGHYIFGYKVDIHAKRLEYDGSHMVWHGEYINFYRIYDNIRSLKIGLKHINRLYDVDDFYVTPLIKGEALNLNAQLQKWWNENE